MSEENGATEEEKAMIAGINRSSGWFPAVKSAPVWAKPADSEQTLSTREGPVTIAADDLICRGPLGDIWGQSPDRFSERYQPTDEVDEHSFRKYLPDPGKSRVFAARIDHDFEISTGRGILRGKGGDYVLKSTEDEATEFPDVWVVGSGIFDATYRKEST